MKINSITLTWVMHAWFMSVQGQAAAAAGSCCYGDDDDDDVLGAT